MNAYVQDDWRVTSRLSINIGIRWEYHRMPVDKRDTMAAFVHLPGKPKCTHGNGVLVVSGEKDADYACTHPLNPNDLGLVACADQRKALGLDGRAGRSLVKPDRFNWAPRFGIAWRPTGSDKFIIRTGYGFFFDPGNFNNLHFVFNNPIFPPNQRSFAPTGQHSLFELGNGFVVRVRYEFVKGINTNEGGEGFGGGLGNVAPQDDNVLRADRGRSYTDARHNAVFSYIYELPFGSGRHFLNQGGVVNKVIGGWQMSGVTLLQSGFPFSIGTGRDLAGTGTLNERPDRVCNGTSNHPTVDQWFDTSCFTTQFMEAALAAGQPRFGNAGRNILDEPGWDVWDVNFSKSTSITERFRTNRPVQMHNTSNHHRFHRP